MGAAADDLREARRGAPRQRVAELLGAEAVHADQDDPAHRGHRLGGQGHGRGRAPRAGGAGPWARPPADDAASTTSAEEIPRPRVGNSAVSIPTATRTSVAVVRAIAEPASAGSTSRGSECR